MICIIPARGGSKRLPNKNLLKLDCEYLINRVIQIAKISGIFDKIIVSTDSMDIASIVKDAIISIRPDFISGDVAEDEVLRWTAKEYDSPVFCRIYPFAVLLTPQRLRNGYNRYMYDSDCDAVLECQKYGHNPIRGLYENGVYINKGDVSRASEQLPDIYHDAGTYIFSSTADIAVPLAERVIEWIIVKEWESQDIDDADDWYMLQAKWEYTKSKGYEDER